MLYDEPDTPPDDKYRASDGAKTVVHTTAGHRRVGNLGHVWLAGALKVVSRGGGPGHFEGASDTADSGDVSMPLPQAFSLASPTLGVRPRAPSDGRDAGRQAGPGGAKRRAVVRPR